MVCCEPAPWHCITGYISRHFPMAIFTWSLTRSRKSSLSGLYLEHKEAWRLLDKCSENKPHQLPVNSQSRVGVATDRGLRSTSRLSENDLSRPYLTPRRAQTHTMYQVNLDEGTRYSISRAISLPQSETSFSSGFSASS